MEKQVFLDRVRQTLTEKGIDDRAIAHQMTRLSRYIDEEGGDHVEQMLEAEDPVLLAEEISSILRRNAARRAAAVAIDDAAEAPAESDAVQEPSGDGAVSGGLVSADEPLPEETVSAPTREIDIVELPSVPLGSGPAADYVELPAPDLDDDVKIADFSSERQRPDKREKRRKTLEVDPMLSRAAEYSGETGGPLFWVLFLLSLPFAAIIGLAVVLLFIGLFALLAAMMVAGFAVLVALAAGGTAFTLVALIYGIVQIFTTLPIGLYEIGIAVTAGASVLFISILLYNFTVRLLPFTMKQLGRFFGWSLRRLKMLFIYVKGACAKL